MPAGKDNFLETAFHLEDYQGLGRRKLWRLVNLFLSEFFATAITLFLGCSAVQGVLFNHKQDHLVIALTFGFGVGTSVTLFGHISGSHINPCLSLASVIVGNMSFALWILYTIAQCTGATFGYSLTRAILPPDTSNVTEFTSSYFASRCCSVPDLSLTTIQVIVTEIIATAVLVWAVTSAWDPRNQDKHDSMPLKFAMVIIALALPTALYSGCSMNPARSFGPAIYNGYWTNHWVYWIGPIIGTIIAATIYRIVFKPAHMQITLTEVPQDPASLKLRNHNDDGC